MSEIRELLAAAQQAEIHRDFPEAIRLLRAAAEWYSTRDLEPRAQQMIRHAARLEGGPSEDFGFGDDLFEGAKGAATNGDSTARFEARGPSRAESGAQAWCSFCCRPGHEAGALVTGPTGSFICADCLEASATLLGEDEVDPPPTPVLSRPAPVVWLPAQKRALDRLVARRGRVVLVVGPQGSGKSALLGHLGVLARPPYTQLPQARLALDLPPRPTPEEERRLLAWLEAEAGRTMVIAAPGVLPAPPLVLSGDAGEEAVYDTRTLASVVDALSVTLLAEVDQVLSLEAPDAAALEPLAAALLGDRGAQLPAPALQALVRIAVDSGRGAHELAALVRRVPPGRYVER